MTVQYSVSVRNARLDALETTIGVSPKMELRTGTKPSNCAAAATGTLLATLTLPSNWMADSVNGVKQLTGTWSGTAASGGEVGYFRITDSSGTVCHVQGSVTASGGGGDMTMDNPSLAPSQAITINQYTITAGNP
jgi:hypothetical protein